LFFRVKDSTRIDACWSIFPREKLLTLDALRNLFTEKIASLCVLTGGSRSGGDGKGSDEAACPGLAQNRDANS
jgi:hypothetical protein